jgi:hypothetical protein
MISNRLLILAIISGLALNGCGGGGGTTATSTEKTVTITEDNQVESLGSADSIHADIDMGSTPRDLYLVLSNSATSSASSTITHTAKIVPKQKTVNVATTVDTPQQRIIKTPDHIRAFNRASIALLQKSSAKAAKTISYTAPKKKDVAGDAEIFYLDTNAAQSTQATARKVVTTSTAYGTKTLNVWVSDDSFDSGSGCSKSTCVTQDMVDTFAATFLQEGEGNDIYDWVTNIYGEEWGSDAQQKYNNLILESDEITILLTDIDNDNDPNGGTIGYFYSKDNFERSSVSGSNERVMFYADSVMFANTDSDDYWQKELYSTLAHEFQHMIHYYRRNILGDIKTDTWMEEMMSETTEDLIATKLDHTGPRGVDPSDGSAGEPENTLGRYPDFNSNNALSLTGWGGTYGDYGKVSAFGAFLVRNYGGAKFLHDIMFDTTHTDYHAVETATGKSFSELLAAWGTAVILSDTEDPDQSIPTYNTGDFIDDSYGNTTYELGSINCFNYDPEPTIKTASGTVEKQANYYYKIGSGLTGTLSVDLTLNGSTEATLIAK